MQIDEGSHRRAGHTQFHACAGGSVEHPRRHDQDYARCDLDVHNITCRSLFTVLPSKTTTIERMPAVEDFDFLPDMGRMTQRLQWVAIMQTAVLCELVGAHPANNEAYQGLRHCA